MSRKEKTLEDAINEMNGDEWRCPKSHVTIVDENGHSHYTITKAGKNITITKKH